MKWRTVAIALFIDDNLNVVVQDRRGVSKVGEKYGFWGGQQEKGETSKQAIKRELEEELGFVPEKLDYWGKFSYLVQEEGKHKDKEVETHIFLSPITPKLMQGKTFEGKGKITMSIDEVISGEGFPGGATAFVREIRDSIKKQKLQL